MKNKLILILVAAMAAVPLLAQDDESRFNEQQADRLNKFAKRAFGKGFPRQAKLIWLQTIKLYDLDDAVAHKALGHVKLGTSWSPDPDFSYPTADTGSGSDGASLFKSYEKLKKDLASAHRTQAQKWSRAERTDKSRYHYQMVLRWVKSDEKAQAALEHREIGGLTGTSLEQTLYERSKMIEQAVVEQSRIDYGVEKMAASTQPYLERAQVKYITVKSEHFTLRGDPEEEENLLKALVWAERALQVAQVAFPKESFPQNPGQWQTDWAFFVSKDTYKQILTANGDRLPNLQWQLEHTSTSGIAGPEGVLTVGATGSVKVLFDAVVRNVARAYAGFGTDGFREGIGHTFVGMIFNNNRLFSVDLMKQQGTTASEEDRQYNSPDFDVWKDLNLELAWRSTGSVPAMELPFCDAAKFTNQQRIKAWSFCDYLMRRDPALLRDMDRLGLEMRRENRTSPMELTQRFGKTHDVTVAQLDKEWEDFWTGASPVLKAIQNDTPPLAAVSKGVEKWLAAYNAARKTRNAVPVAWSANLSTRCHDHAVYLKANKKQRGPVAEHSQDPAMGGTHLGSMFAQMAVVVTSAKISKAKDMFQGWLDIPGYRDGLVNNYIRTAGLYSMGDILVMNLVSDLGPPQSKSRQGYHCYPRNTDTRIPREVAVELLGPELRQLLEKHGHGKLKKVGYPLTLHFGVSVPGNRSSYRCAVTTSRGDAVEGLILLDGGTIRRTSAPGMVTFFPLEPLARGEITATWTWEQGSEVRRLKASFTTK